MVLQNELVKWMNKGDRYSSRYREFFPKILKREKITDSDFDRILDNIKDNNSARDTASLAYAMMDIETKMILH